jgi:hypothetical protein
MTKTQTQSMTNYQITMTNARSLARIRDWDLVIGHWSIDWVLGLGHWSFFPPRRLSFLLWFSVLAALAAGPLSYTDQQSRFAVTCPSDWTRVNPPAVGQIFSARTPDFPPSTQPTTSPSTRPAADFGTLGIALQEDPQSTSDALTLHDVSAGIADFAFNHGGTHVTIKPDKIDGIDARRIRFHTGGKSAVVVVVVKDHVAVIINATAPADRFDGYLPQVQAALDGMKIPAN